MNFAEKVIRFNQELQYTGHPLPPGIRVMNPFRESELAMSCMQTFYRKYYNDQKSRHLILGINPGRFGAGLTGIPFTDPKRLISECGIPYAGKMTHEPSSVFVYEMIHAYGGVEQFYKDLYIHSVCPLGFTSIDARGKEKNYNYYDSPALYKAVEAYILWNLRQQIAMGLSTELCFCMGTGKNEQFLRRLNDQHGFFKKIIALEHPRFIVQYKSKSMPLYIDKYLSAFGEIKA